MANFSRQATSLRPGQFRHLIRVAGVSGRMPERDQMLLWITHTKGIRVTELALLRIDDLLLQSGAIIKLGSSHSGRRTLADRVLSATGDVETVQAVLGHQALDHTKPYLTVEQETFDVLSSWRYDEVCFLNMRAECDG